MTEATTMISSNTSTATVTTVDVVDINLLHKVETTKPGTNAKEDSSLDATVRTSCESLSEHDTPSCSDGESVEESVQSPPSTAPLPSPVEGGDKQRRVSFSNVVVREFPRCLGDNPSVSEGPPLTVGWKPCNEYTKDVDAYEKQRDEEIEAIYAEQASRSGVEAETPKRRRKPYEFNLPCRERVMILHWECGSSNEFAQAAGTACSGIEIKNMIRDTQKTRRQRRTSKTLLQFEDYLIKVEGCNRKLKKLLMGKEKTRQQKELANWGNDSSSSLSCSSSTLHNPQVKSILKVAVDNSNAYQYDQMPRQVDV